MARSGTVGQPLSDRRGNVPSPLGDSSDRAEQLLGFGILENVSAGPGLQSAVDFLIAAVRCQHKDVSFRIDAPDGFDCLHASQSRHPQVHEGRVGPQVIFAHRLATHERPFSI
jgi:hypothetical protein